MPVRIRNYTPAEKREKSGDNNHKPDETDEQYGECCPPSPSPSPCKSRKKYCNKKNNKNKKYECKNTKISRVPYVISKSGTYCLTDNLTYDGDDIAIRIDVPNVTIDFKGHEIVCISDKAKGIVSNGTPTSRIRNIRLYNGSVALPETSSNPESIGLDFRYNGQVIVDTFYVRHFFYAIHTIDTHDFVGNLLHLHVSLGGNAWFEDSEQLSLQNVQIKNRTANQLKRAVHFHHCQNAEIKNSRFENGVVMAHIVDNVNIEGLSSQIKDTTYSGAVLMFGKGGGESANNVLVKDCVLGNIAAAATGGVITINSGKNYLIDTCSLISKAETGLALAVVRVGGLTLPDFPQDIQSVKLNNCQINGTNSTKYGVGVIKDPISSVSGVTVSNSNISGTVEIGVGYDGETSGNVIKDSEIINNLGVGLKYKVGTLNNLYKNNNFISNVVGNVINDGTNNVGINNTMV